MTQRIVEQFARLLEYPGPLLVRDVDACIAELDAECAAAAELLRDFRGALVDAGVPRLEEIYTATFDLGEDCCPYLGHHLFAEPWRRNVFMARLQALYREHGLRPDGEVPDHLCRVLRFLAEHGGTEEADDLERHCVLPVLGKLSERMAPANPYGMVVEALRQWLSTGRRTGREASVQRRGVELSG